MTSNVRPVPGTEPTSVGYTATAPGARMPKHTFAPSAANAAGDEIALTYAAHYPLLEYLAVQRFRIPDEDVGCLIHEVFVAFIRNREKIRNQRTWLVGATCIECRTYWRARGRDELGPLAVDADLHAVTEDLAARVDASIVLGGLPDRCRELLRLRFIEGYSSAEIARQFATTVDYARKLVHRCLSSARALFSRKRGERS